MALAALLPLSACGGGSSSAPSLPAATIASAKPVAVAFNIKIPQALSKASKLRRPAYVSPGTQKAQISVNGTVTNLTCTSSACNGTVNAGVGLDAFTVTLTDSAGAVLSAGTVNATIEAGRTNTVNVSCGGIPQTSRISAEAPAPSFAAGTAASAKLDIAVLDADGYTIIGNNWDPTYFSLSVDAPSAVPAPVNPASTAFANDKAILTPNDNAVTVSYDGSPTSANDVTVTLEQSTDYPGQAVANGRSGSVVIHVTHAALAGPAAISVLGIGPSTAITSVVSELNYGSQALTVTVADTSVATATIGSTANGQAMLTVTGLKFGTTTITVADASGQTLTIPVTVTTTSITVK